MSFENVPEELQERDQWLLWSSESDPPKKPLNAEGYGASWTDPSEWLSFDDAVELANTGQFDGIGFVITEGDPYVGLDLDGCLREPFQEKPKDWLPDLDDLRGTYIEYSQSGTGLHPFVKDVRLPDWWSDSHFTDDEHEGVEAYESKFFIVTGKPVETLTGPTIQEVEIGPFLSEAYEVITGEPPRLPGGDQQPTAGSGGEIGVYDVISRSSYPEDKNVAHPFHPSGTGTNFRVDRGGETFRCWRHEVTGNGAHLLGIEQGIIECGEWERGLDASTWRDIYDAGREAGYDIPRPEGGQSRAVPNGGQAAADGGATTSSDADTDEPAPPEYESLEEVVETEVIVPLNPEKYGVEDEIRKINSPEAVERFANILDRNYSFVRPREDTRGWRDTLYVYSEADGIYEPHGKSWVETEAERLLGQWATNHRVKEIVSKIERRNRVNERELEPEPHRLVVANGILDLTKGELDDLTFDEYHRTMVPVDWNPDSECPHIDRFLHDVVDDSDVDTLYRFIAHCLYKEYYAEKAAMLLGDGENGKSTFLSLVQRFLGSWNVSNQSLIDLNIEDFAAQNLVGKLCNIHPDLSNQSVKTLQMFKKLTGRDAIDADVKFEQPVTFENYATLIFACNRMPALHDDTRGNWRRWVLIEFPYTFERDDDDYVEKSELMDRITADEELEGLLVRCVEEIKRATQRGEQWFPSAPGWRETRKQIMRASEPVYDFAEVCLEESADEDAALPKDVVRQCYRAYAAAEGLPTMSREKFGQKLLNETDIAVETGQMRIDGVRRRVYKGVDLTSRGTQLLEDEGAAEALEANQSSLDNAAGGPRERADRVYNKICELTDKGETISEAELAGAMLDSGLTDKQIRQAIGRLIDKGRVSRGDGDELEAVR